MANNGLTFIESFDAIATADLPGKWTNVSGAVIAAGQGRNGTACGRLNLGTGSEVFSVTLSATQKKCVGFAWRRNLQAPAANTICSFVDVSTIQLAVQVNPDWTLSVLRGGTVLSTTTFALSINTYYYIEFLATIASSGGAYDLRVNGVSRTSGSGVNTQNTGNATANVVRLSNTQSSGSYAQDYDDVYICEGAAAAFLGDVRVVCVRPDSAGTYIGFSPTPATANWQNVDDATPNGDTDYNETSLTTTKDTYGFAALGVSGTVYGVQLTTVAKNTDATPTTFSNMTRGSGFDTVGGTVHSPTTVYQHFRQMWENSPVSATNWTTAEVDASEFGVARLT